MKNQIAALLLLLTVSATAQNLVINPGAEIPISGITGWQIASQPPNTAPSTPSTTPPVAYGVQNWRVAVSGLGATAKSGSYIFYPGCYATSGTSHNSTPVATYELYQDVDV